MSPGNQNPPGWTITALGWDEDLQGWRKGRLREREGSGFLRIQKFVLKVLLFMDVIQRGLCALLGNWFWFQASRSYNKYYFKLEVIAALLQNVLMDSRSVWKNSMESLTVFLTCGTAGFPRGTAQLVFCFLPPNLANYSDTLLKIQVSRILPPTPRPCCCC